MVARGAGAVGCTHCKAIGADRACAICRRLVCPRCAADWATCEEPSGRVVRLGLTARVRDVDPLGRVALVSHWRRPLRLFDLRRLRWLELELPRRYWLFARAHPPRLSSAGLLYYPEYAMTGGQQSPHFIGIRAHVLANDTTRAVSSHEPYGSTGVTAIRDRFYYVTAAQQVAITTTAGERAAAVSLEQVAVVDPLPRKVVHAIHVDAERDLLAAGSWSEIVLHAIVDGRLERLGYTKTAATGDVRWIAVAGPWLAAAITATSNSWRIEVRRLEANLSIGAIAHTHTGMLRAASLSRDGRYLALGFDHGLVVHELGTDHVTTFDEHTDHINYVRFAADDHVLVSADTDNRIVMRPRTPTGYARPLVALDVPEQPIPLPPLETTPR